MPHVVKQISDPGKSVRKRLVFVVMAAMLAAAISSTWRFRPEQAEPASSSSTRNIAKEGDKSAAPHASGLPRLSDTARLNEVSSAFSASIDFFGKIVDPSGCPIADAKVHYSAADKYFGDGSKYEGVSDTNGLFSLLGVKGAGLYVDVSKAGYERIANKSYASFGYGMSTASPPPTRERPALFTLRKKGEGEPLIVVSNRQFPISKGRSLFAVDLKTGRQTRTETASVIFETEIAGDKDNPNLFDWRGKISVPGGGLLERLDDFAFDAPPDGYRQSDEVNMQRSSNAWKRDVSKMYFVRLGDGNFALLKVEFVIGGAFDFVVLESYLNPAGSPNLEYDPAKAVKAK